MTSLNSTEMMDAMADLLMNIGTSGLQAVLEHDGAAATTPYEMRRKLNRILNSDTNWLTWWIGYNAAQKKFQQK